MEKLLLKPGEVMEILGIGRSRVYEMLACRELPSVRIGRSIRIPVNALNQWIEDRQAETANDSAPDYGSDYPINRWG